MKLTKLIILFLLLTLSTQAQHKGNFDQSISRQNIATGNATVYGNTPRQVTPNLNPNSTIVIDVRALQNVKASSYTAIFNVSQIGETAEITNSLLNDRVINIKTELSKIGILEKDIAIDVISFVPCQIAE